MEIKFENDFDTLVESLFLRLTHGILFCITFPITIICYYGLIHFEHYGGDAMKRGIKNKLIAQAFVAILTFSCINNPMFAWRILIGPLNESITMLNIFCRHFMATYGCLCFTNIILWKVLILFGWKHFCSIGNFYFMKIIFSNSHLSRSI